MLKKILTIFFLFAFVFAGIINSPAAHAFGQDDACVSHTQCQDSDPSFDLQKDDLDNVADMDSELPCNQCGHCCHVSSVFTGVTAVLFTPIFDSNESVIEADCAKLSPVYGMKRPPRIFA